MGLGQWLRAPRRTLTLFIAMTLALAASLPTAAWFVVRQDQRQRQRVRLERDVDLIAVSLSNWLNEIELKLASLDRDAVSIDDRSMGWVGSTSAVVWLTGSDARVWPAGRLAYFASSSPAPGDPGGVLRATTLIDEARVLRNQGRAAASLAIYERLANIDARVLNDTPAELVAREARAAILNDLGRRDDAAREAALILSALRQRQWGLAAGTYSYYANRASLWMSSSGITSQDAFPDAREALAVAASDLHDSLATSTSSAGGRRLIWIDRHPLLVISRPAREGIVAFIGSTADAASAIRSQQETPFTSMSLGLVDAASGRLTFGHLPPPSTDRIVRTGAEAGLPWSIYAASATTINGAQEPSLATIAILLGAGLVGCAVLAGGFFTARAMHRELEVARIQTDFVSAVSHEFRTPLAAFEQLSELLVDGRVTSETDRQEYHRRLHRESRRLRRLVEDLLDFRRMEAGAREFQLEPIDPAALVSGIVGEFVTERAARPDDVRLLMEMLPQIRGDREAIGRAIWNLLDNAMKYAPGSQIVVAATSVPNGIRISVSDRGPGIPRDRHEDIFRRFVRANGVTSAGTTGTGLGLAMVRRIAEGHGGRATVESEPGRGSTFMIELPQ